MTTPAGTRPSPGKRLDKELGLWDVYAISTGAMFSSGFFLLPGLAAAQTGPSVALAYLVAGVFIIPAMFSVAELATAMPRAGGAYYFLDRSLGPLVGTVGGLGTWLALILKSAFALVGMGAYLALYFDMPIEALAIGLTVAFAGINIVGAKETTGLQRVLVGTLLAIMVVFIVLGLASVGSRGLGAVTSERFTPFMPFGLAGFMSTVGFVFVSYAGLTKVASVAEEVSDPDRSIPLGMMLSLGTAAVVYGVGVYIMVALLPPEELRADLTPVASAAAAFGSGGIIVALIVVAAIAAFASTGNAGILSASRYPLAMARDGLVAPQFATLGRFRTPSLSIVVTGAIVIAAIVALPVEDIAKLASAFQLLLFSLLCLAVVIMRESGIEGYVPGYRSPLYPWMQVFGFVAPLWLIAEMGQMAILFTLGLIAVTVGWYLHYAAPRVRRTGAIFHTFARLGERRHSGLDLELRRIVEEKGVQQDDHFEEIVARAEVVDIEVMTDVEGLVARAAERLEHSSGVSGAELERTFLQEFQSGLVPLGHGTAIPHMRLEGLPEPLLLLARCRQGIDVATTSGAMDSAVASVRAVLFLISPKDAPGRHLRLLGHLATRIEDPNFLVDWSTAESASELRATLLPDERLVQLEVEWGFPTEHWIGVPLKSVDLPPGTLVALIRRAEGDVVPEGATVLQAGDRLSVLGDPEGIRALKAAAGRPRDLSMGSTGNTPPS